MKLLFNYIPFQLLLGMIVAILLAINLTLPEVIVCLTLLLGFLYSVHKCYTYHSGYLYVLGVVGIGFIWGSFVMQRVDLPAFSVDVHKPHWYTFQLSEKLKTTATSQRYIVTIQSVDSVKVPSAKILFTIPSNQPALEWLKSYVIYTKLHKTKPPISPFHFNYQQYLANQGVYFQMFTKITPLVFQEHQSVVHLIRNAREQLVAKLHASQLHPQTKAILAAMLLGEKQLIDFDTYQAFKNTGTIHLIAISGMHVGIVYLILQWVLSIFKLNGNLSWVIMLSVLGLFALFSGATPSVVRAVVMFGCVAFAKLLNRRNAYLEVVTLSILGMLSFRPKLLFDVGFQLSYMAVISILLWNPVLQQKIKIKNRWLSKLKDVFVVTLVAQIGILPLCLFYFHQFPLHFLLPNIIAILGLPFIMYGGVVMLIFIGFQISVSFITRCFDTYCLYYLAVIQYFADFKSWVLTNIYFDAYYVFAYYGLFILIFEWYIRKNSDFKYWFLIGSVFVVFLQNLFLVQNAKKSFVLVTSDKTSSCMLVNHQTLWTFPDVKIDEQLCYGLGINQFKKLSGNLWQFTEATFLIMDADLKTNNLPKGNIHTIIHHHPKVNFERVLRNIQPKEVVIGSDMYEWERKKITGICKILQIPVYDIKLHGAYLFYF